MNFGGIITTCIIGLVVGAIAKLLMPGKDPGGCIITILLGLAGAWVGTFIGQATFGGANYVAGWIMSIVGAMLLLLIYRLIMGRRR
ncbi:MAG: GlsB/YeaQ/YmgE family stress response membrane protein [Verrucomicrobiota bacterium]|nr:GlsB/YeaQ/YmgE family stress response membrane protein [Verrucomicrobiota bacterium]